MKTIRWWHLVLAALSLRIMPAAQQPRNPRLETDCIFVDAAADAALQVAGVLFPGCDCRHKQAWAQAVRAGIIASPHENTCEEDIQKHCYVAVCVALHSTD